LDRIAKLKRGNMVIIQDIQAKSPGGEVLRLKPLILTLN
jgi:hypothetical protein